MPSTRSRVCVVLIICIGATLCFAQAQAARSDSKAEDQLMQLERDWLAADAKGDVGSLRGIISDDFIGSGFNGRLLRKEDIMPEAGTPGGFADATPGGDTNVRVFGDTGVLMGVINTAGGLQPKQVRVILVCQKRRQGWQMIAAQLTHVN
jgi:Domain of unknown function (DUF4440)